MDKHLLPALRKEIENTFGRKVLSSRDCLQLVDDLYHKTGYTVNANTLRRFFGLVQTQYSASPSTLTILSKYCGFGSVDEILQLITLPQAGEKKELAADEVLHYLVSLFKNLPVAEGHNPVAESVILQTVSFLDRHPGLIDPFQREIARTTAGQYYYYELSVNMDQLNGYYGDGLLYYIRARPTDEAQLFAHSLQVFRYWLTGDRAGMDKHMQVLQTLSVTNACPSHVLGRLIAARIFYAQVCQEPVEPILGDATKYLVSLLAGSRDIPIPTYPDFELAVCEALVLTGMEDEGAEYIRRGKSLLAFSRQDNPVNPFAMWEYIIGSRKETLRRQLPGKKSGLLPSYNYYLHRKYNNLVLLTLTKHTKRQQQQLDQLVTETGYTAFRKIKSRSVTEK
ncbi:MAG: hypothetical protein QM781_05000 [Chitinophagaceae bacterium]